MRDKLIRILPFCPSSLKIRSYDARLGGSYPNQSVNVDNILFRYKGTDFYTGALNVLTDEILEINSTSPSQTSTIMNKVNTRLQAQYDAISDIFVAPLGRIAGLASMLQGISAVTSQFEIDKDHDRAQLRKDIEGSFKALFDRPERLDIQTIVERTSNGIEHFQMTVVNTAAEKELVSFVRFTDSGKMNAGTLRMAAFDDHTLSIANAIAEKYQPSIEFSITILDVVDGQVSTSTQKVSSKEAELYNSFYPFIEEGADNLIQEFYKSRSNVMIFTGIQGSGKSGLFRSMLNYNKKGKFYVIDNPAIYKNPDALSAVLTFLRKNSKDCQVTVGLEEIDAFVKEKDLDNMLLPRLLSISAGVVSSNIKFVLLANVPSVGQYAESLTRDGRTFAAINFRDLSPDEAAAARAEFGLAPMPFDENHTLSTVLNSRVRKPKKVRTSIGFNN